VYGVCRVVQGRDICRGAEYMVHWLSPPFLLPPFSLRLAFARNKVHRPFQY